MEVEELARKVSDLERKVSDLDYDLRRGLIELEDRLNSKLEQLDRRKADVHHHHRVTGD